MARRTASGTVKSPVNIVVGLLLRRLRDRAYKQLDQAGPALEVSPAYLAAIEAGTNALPAKSVVGLATLGLDFVAAAALLALVSYLDCRIRNARVYDFREIELRAERLLTEPGASAFKPFLEWAVATVKTIESTPNPDSQRGADILESALAQFSHQPNPEIAHSKTEALASRYNLSPMLEDLLDTAASGLSLLTPHINRFNFAAWEAANAGRMFEVRAYVDDAERFLADAANFDWLAILLNPHRPTITIAVPGRTSLSELDIADRFHKQVPLYARSPSLIDDVKRQIKFIKVKPRKIENQVYRGLVYDFSRGQIVREEIWSALGKKLLSQKRYSEFDNVWLYKLKSYPDQPSASNLVGILGTYDDDDISSFGVFIDRNDCRMWWELINFMES
jgi:hypothetical protein